MKNLIRYLGELKFVLNSPKLYLVDYFDKIRNQIDLDCEIYLNGKIEIKNREKATQQQEEMIKEVDLFEMECLSDLKTRKRDSTDLEVLKDCLKSLDFEDEDAVLMVEKQIYCALFERKKILLGNRSIIFLNESKIQEIHLFRQQVFGSQHFDAEETLVFTRLELCLGF